MKLIRKDYAQDIVVNESKKHSGFEFCYKPVYDKITDCVEVDAIPIEWIETYEGALIIKQLFGSASAIKTMLKMWEKENETNR